MIWCSPPPGYRNPDELFAAFEAIVSNYSDIAMLVDITATYNAPLSHEGRHIWALKISVTFMSFLAVGLFFCLKPCYFFLLLFFSHA